MNFFHFLQTWFDVFSIDRFFFSFLQIIFSTNLIFPLLFSLWSVFLIYFLSFTFLILEIGEQRKWADWILLLFAYMHKLFFVDLKPFWSIGWIIFRSFFFVSFWSWWLFVNLNFKVVWWFLIIFSVILNMWIVSFYFRFDKNKSKKENRIKANDCWRWHDVSRCAINTSTKVVFFVISLCCCMAIIW